MRIIGGKDYYDHGLSFGIDSSIVFVRKPFMVYEPSMWSHVEHTLPKFSIKPGAVEEPVSWRISDRSSRWAFDDIKYTAEPVSVFFCGKLSKGIRVYWESKTPFRNMDETGGSPAKRNGFSVRQETFWDLNSFNKWAAKRKVSIGTKRSFFGRANPPPFSKAPLSSEELTPYLNNGIVIASWYPDQEKMLVRSSALGRDQKVHAWLCNSDKLKEFDFIKILDPVKAFQEISMWVGGVLPRPGNPIVEIQDDAIKLAKHGMDKTSFRKPSSKVS